MPARMPEEQYQPLLDRVEALTAVRSTPYEEMQALIAWHNKGLKRGDPRRLVLNSEDPKRSIFPVGRNNDPFYGGVPAQLELALWFAEMHPQVARGRRFHLRFLFYMAVGEEKDPDTGEVMTTYGPDGKKLEKIDSDWEMFQEASRFARNADLIDPGLILESRKNVFVIENSPSSYVPTLGIEVAPPEASLSSPSGSRSVIRGAGARPEGYRRSQFSVVDQSMVPSLIEVWVEKELSDGDEKIVENVCAQENVNLVIASGYVTLSTTAEVLKRQREFGKPLRVLYLNDFDDAGLYMPIGPSRHLEFAIRKMDPKPDIRLYQLAITPEQVFEQNLPTKIPLTPKQVQEERERRQQQKNPKKPNFRRENWEAKLKQGLGIVQLNTLTFPTRAPWFKETLRAAIRALRDPEILERFEQTEREAQALLDAEVDRRFGRIHRVLNTLGNRAEEIVEEVTSSQAEEREELDRRENELMRQYGEILRQRRELDRVAEAELEPLEARAERVLGTWTRSRRASGRGG